MRFTVEKNWCDRDNMYFYDVVDHHPLRHRRVVSWYTEKPTFKGDRNYGYNCAKEDADHFNLKFGYDTGHLAEQTFNKTEHYQNGRVERYHNE